MTPEKISRWIVYGCALYILGAIVFLKPHFGLMDDATNLFLLQPKIAESGLLRGMWNYFLEDMGWGMTRLLYPALVYFLYSIGLAFGAVPMYFVNAIIVIALFYFHARLMEKLLNINRWYILLCSCGFFYGYDLFQHPSLQEKYVLFFGMLLLAVSSNKALPPWKKIPLCILLSLFGVTGKTSFFIYICTSYLFLIPTKETYREKARWVIFISLTSFYLILFAACSYVSSHGHYTTTFHKPENIIKNIQTLDFFILVIPAIIAFAIFFRRSILELNFIRLFPAVSVLAYLAIFLGWGISGYIQTIITPLFSTLVIQLAMSIFPAKKWHWFIPLSILAVVVCSYRGYSMFIRLGDVRRIVEKAKDLREQGVDDVYMPCQEAWHTMRDYFKFHSNVEMRFHYLPHDQVTAKALNGKYLLYDRGLCPLPGKLVDIPGCTAKIFFQGEFSRSFRLVRLYCP